MLRVAVYVLFIGMSLSFKVSPTYIFSGRITYTQDYCGGAAPPQDLIEKLKTPKPLANKKIYFKKGRVNGLNKTRIGYFTTDSLGRFNIKLTASDYVFFDESKLRWEEEHDMTESVNMTIDYKCLLDKHMKGDFTIKKTQKNLKDYAFNYHYPCAYNLPCIEYHGPYPPAVAPQQGGKEPTR
ncbi:MAG: hypothetical protein HYZ42_03880 [Bacteroidetes bacterium]|nr:hypothetical protein [Bacteroidota bacterium]